MAAPPLWLRDFILATSLPLRLFTVSYGQVTMMFDVFCQFAAFTSDFQQEWLLGKMDSLNNHCVHLMTMVFA